MNARLAHTGITWGIPGDPEAALSEIAEIGYRGFETFGFVLAERDLGPVSRSVGVPVVAAFCEGTFNDPASLEGDLANIERWAALVQDLGGEVIVLGAKPRVRESNSAEDYRTMAAGLNVVGRRCRELGLVAALHPHTGTPVETREEIDRILEATDPELVRFAPDSGQIAKGGSDPVEVFRRYGERIGYVHLKDWNGCFDERDGDRSGYLNYEPLGNGVVDVRGLLEALSDVDYDGWIAVELDGTPDAPRPPAQDARMSYEHLRTLVGVA
jgi:inosose dehydratase